VGCRECGFFIGVFKRSIIKLKFNDQGWLVCRLQLGFVVSCGNEGILIEVFFNAQ